VGQTNNQKVGEISVGLCADCVHVRRIESARGSTFYLCQLSATDPTFSKYPRLPVIVCSGFEKK
jgi:hypothetical protein